MGKAINLLGDVKWQSPQKRLPHEVLNYKNIEAVYNTVVITRTNPVSGKPVVFLVSEETFEKEK